MFCLEVLMVVLDVGQWYTLSTDAVADTTTIPESCVRVVLGHWGSAITGFSMGRAGNWNDSWPVVIAGLDS